MADVSKEMIECVLSHYDPLLTLDEIARLSSTSYTTVWRALNVSGISTARGYDPAPHHIENLDAAWVDEFKGFFYADGYAGLKRRSAKESWNVSPALSIVQRADSIDLISSIHEKLGGALRTYDPKLSSDSYTSVANQMVAWAVYGYSPCLAVIEATNLHISSIGARKANQVKLLYEAILVRFSMPHHTTNEQKETMREYYYTLKELKRFSC